MRKERVSAAHSRYRGYSNISCESGRAHLPGVVLGRLPCSSIQDVRAFKGVDRRIWGNRANRGLITGFDRIEDVNKHCLAEFRKHWTCLDNNNQQLWQCRPAEWKLNKCVFDNLVRNISVRLLDYDAKMYAARLLTCFESRKSRRSFPIPQKAKLLYISKHDRSIRTMDHRSCLGVLEWMSMGLYLYIRC